MVTELAPRSTADVEVSRQKLRRFEADHARRITDELGRLARRVEKNAFGLEQLATGKTGGNGHRVMDATFDVLMLRVNRVGDALSRDWVILPNGGILTCSSFLLSPDILDISTICRPDPRDVIADQERLMKELLLLPRAR